MPKVLTRRPKFQKVKPSTSLQITSRDFQILKSVHSYRFLNSRQIQRLVGSSSQSVLRRLQWLFHHGYLDRPKAQLDYFVSGSKPMVYGIGRKGMNLLKEKGLVASERNLKGSVKRPVSKLFLQHALAVSEVMVALELDCRKYTKVRFIHSGEILDSIPNGGFANRLPSSWKVRVKGKSDVQSIGVVPDQIFALEHQSSPGKKSRVLYFLEVDRSTMPVIRKGLRQSSVYRKILAYYETWKQGITNSLFRFDRFRVLMVTSSPHRIPGMIASTRKVGDQKGSRLFLFADQNTIFKSGDIFKVLWQSGREPEAESLLNG